MFRNSHLIFKYSLKFLIYDSIDRIKYGEDISPPFILSSKVYNASFCVMKIIQITNTDNKNKININNRQLKLPVEREYQKRISR